MYVSISLDFIPVDEHDEFEYELGEALGIAFPQLVDSYLNDYDVSPGDMADAMWDDIGVNVEPAFVDYIIRKYNIIRFPRFSSAGPNETWAICGRSLPISPDLTFTVYGIVDKFSQRLLDLRVVHEADPKKMDDRVRFAVFMRIVKKCGGTPIHLMSEGGNPSPLLVEAQRQMREHILPGSPYSKKWPYGHEFDKPVSWARAFYDLEDMFADILSRYGHEEAQLPTGYDHGNPLHRGLVEELWLPRIQQELDDYKRIRNGLPVSEDLGDLLGLPSGVAPNNLFKYAPQSMLIKVPLDLIDGLAASGDMSKVTLRADEGCRKAAFPRRHADFWRRNSLTHWSSIAKPGMINAIIPSILS